MRQDEGKNIVYGVLLSFPLAIVELILAIIISGLYAGATGNYFVMERAKPGIYSVNKKNCKKFFHKFIPPLLIKPKNNIYHHQQYPDLL